MKRRHLWLVSTVAVLAGFTHARVNEPTRWALIVGVGDYQNFGDEVGGDLPGATNDARNMREVLIARWEFPEENVRLLLDHEATRSAIESGFTEWLPSVVRPGDMVVFYFAGHGSQMWDKSGDEGDGLDETICPTDVLRKTSSKDIPDDQLAGWIKRLPTKNVTVILDSCHSGTATRAVTPHARPRALARNVHADLPREGVVTTRSVGSAAKSADDSFGEGVLEIAAARSDQYAIDAVWLADTGTKHTRGGAFTTPFVQYLWQVPPGTTYEEVFHLTREAMKRRGFAQNPQIDSTGKRRPLFAVARPAPSAPQPEPIALAPVLATPPAAAGAAMAAAPAPTALAPAEATPVTPQALPSASAAPAPAVTPASGPAPAPENARGSLRVTGLPAPGKVSLDGGSAAGVTVGSIYHAGGRHLRVETVDPQGAYAALISHRGITVKQDSLGVGSVARLVSYRFPDPVLRVGVADLPADAAGALKVALKAHPALVLEADPAAVTDLLVRAQGSRYVVLGLDGFTRHSVEAPSAASGVAELAPILLQEFGARQLASLENPAQPFALDFSFGEGRTSFKVGEWVSFRIRSARSGYLTIIDVDAAGKVNVLFPSDMLGGDNRIEAGQEILLPTLAMGGGFTIGPPIGRNVVRVFVTERPLVLPFSVAEAARAELVAQALRTAAGPSPLPSGDAVPVESWATTSIIYDITD